MIRLGLLTAGRVGGLTCASGIATVDVAEESLCELSAVGLPNNPPFAWTKVRPDELGSTWVGTPWDPPISPPPKVGFWGVDAVLELRVADSPDLLNMEGTVSAVGGPPNRDVFTSSGAALVGGMSKGTCCIFDRSSFLYCGPGVLHWPKVTFGDAGRGFGSDGVATGSGSIGVSWPEIGLPVSGELRVGLAEGLPSPIPYDDVDGVDKLALSIAGVEGGVVLGSRDCCVAVASGEGNLTFVGLGVTLGELEDDLESGCNEESLETGEATFVESGVDFFLGLCVVSPSSPDSRGRVVSSATGDNS